MGSLRFLVVLFSLSVLCTVEAALDPSEYGPKIEELMNTMHSSCISQSGTDETTIKNVINGIFVDEPKIKIYMTCLLTFSKVIDEAGVFHYERIGEVAPPKFKEEIVNILKNCGTKVNDIANIEDRAFAFFSCFYHANPDLFVFF